MLKWIFGKKTKEDEQPSQVKLSSLSRWLQGQMKEEVHVHLHMLGTVFESVPEEIEKLKKVLQELEQAPLRSLDFPDAPPGTNSAKNRVVEQIRKSIQEMEIIVRQGDPTVDDYLNKYTTLHDRLKEIQQTLSVSASRVRPYYALLFKKIAQHVEQLQKIVLNAQDVLTSPVFKKLTEVHEHIRQSLDKLSKQKELQQQIDEIQPHLDSSYKEFLRYEVKINEIKNSQRYQLETSRPRGSRGSSIGHFSVLEQEVKELEDRKKRVSKTLHIYQEQNQQLKARLESMSIDTHIERILDIVEQLTGYTVEILRE